MINTYLAVCYTLILIFAAVLLQNDTPLNITLASVFGLSILALVPVIIRGEKK